MIAPIRTYRPWWQRAVDAGLDNWRQWRRADALHQLDRRTLADLGLDRSEVSSVFAESSARAQLTRLRIAAMAAWRV